MVKLLPGWRIPQLEWPPASWRGRSFQRSSEQQSKEQPSEMFSPSPQKAQCSNPLVSEPKIPRVTQIIVLSPGTLWLWPRAANRSSSYHILRCRGHRTCSQIGSSQGYWRWRWRAWGGQRRRQHCPLFGASQSAASSGWGGSGQAWGFSGDGRFCGGRVNCWSDYR